ncbi:MAG: EAL domain-containing protein [Pseudomonadota bacterium]|nr:EAL domain-containing protein [Pseudomonadota bacterium]
MLLNKDPAEHPQGAPTLAESPQAEWSAHQLHSHFQPIVSLAHSRVVGHEALLRATTGNGLPVSPQELFAKAERCGEVDVLDRRALATHFAGYAQAKPEGWLFVNVAARRFSTDPNLAAELFDALSAQGLLPSQVVIEVLESELQDSAVLRQTVEELHEYGCLIALDDFGAGHSNLDRIWRLKPHLIKLDRSLVGAAAREPLINRIMPGLVGLIHEANALVLMEGVETEREALIAMEADVDLVQGYYFGRPAATLQGPTVAHTQLDRLWSLHGSTAGLTRQRHREFIAPYRNAIGYGASLLRAGYALEAAAQPFMALAQAECCFLLDADGIQVGANVGRSGAPSAADARFEPLRSQSGAVWSRRPYFQRALSRPGAVHVTRPYFSLAGLAQCITVSVAERVGEQMRIFCGDVRIP